MACRCASRPWRRWALRAVRAPSSLGRRLLCGRRSGTAALSARGYYRAWHVRRTRRGARRLERAGPPPAPMVRWGTGHACFRLYFGDRRRGKPSASGRPRGRTCGSGLSWADAGREEGPAAGTLFFSGCTRVPLFPSPHLFLRVRLVCRGCKSRKESEEIGVWGSPSLKLMSSSEERLQIRQRWVCGAGSRIWYIYILAWVESAFYADIGITAE